MDSTSDKCRSVDYITVAGQRVDKGASNKIINLPGLQKETKWYCGSAEERTEWDKPANELRVTTKVMEQFAGTFTNAGQVLCTSAHLLL